MNYITFFTLFLIFCLPLKAKSEIYLDPNTKNQLTAEETLSFFKVIHQLNQTLPVKMKSTIQHPVLIRWTAFDSKQTLSPPICPSLGKHPTEENSTIYGSYHFNPVLSSSAVISLNQNFIPLLRGGSLSSQKYPCGHKDTYRLLLATLIHELGHAYDRAQGLISNSDEFRTLIQWHPSAFTDFPKNKNFHQSPDPYEWTHRSEYFAVNLEFFLLDPEYRCRRPHLFKYYSEHFEHTPYSDQARCQIQTKAPDFDTFHPIDLNPERVYQIHYMVATQGREAESKAGHAMLRIVSCSPTRQKVSEDCLNDIENHAVIGYWMNHLRSDPSLLESLLGKRPSQPSLYPFKSILRHYGFKNRDILSIPLKLNPDEIRNLIFLSLEMIWGYKGKYHLITNNSGTEIYDLMKILLPDRFQFPKRLLTGPIALMNDFIYYGIGDRIFLKKPEALNRYFFPASKKEEALEIVQTLTYRAESGTLSKKDLNNEELFLNLQKLAYLRRKVSPYLKMDLNYGIPTNFYFEQLLLDPNFIEFEKTNEEIKSWIEQDPVQND